MVVDAKFSQWEKINIYSREKAGGRFAERVTIAIQFGAIRRRRQFGSRPRSPRTKEASWLFTIGTGGFGSAIPMEMIHFHLARSPLVNRNTYSASKTADGVFEVPAQLGRPRFFARGRVPLRTRGSWRRRTCPGFTSITRMGALPATSRSSPAKVPPRKGEIRCEAFVRRKRLY